MQWGASVLMTDYINASPTLKSAGRILQTTILSAHELSAGPGKDRDREISADQNKRSERENISNRHTHTHTHKIGRASCRERV